MQGLELRAVAEDEVFLTRGHTAHLQPTYCCRYWGLGVLGVLGAGGAGGWRCLGPEGIGAGGAEGCGCWECWDPLCLDALLGLLCPPGVGVQQRAPGQESG